MTGFDFEIQMKLEDGRTWLRLMHRTGEPHMLGWFEISERAGYPMGAVHINELWGFHHAMHGHINRKVLEKNGFKIIRE
jgi:hypothetical protein